MSRRKRLKILERTFLHERYRVSSRAAERREKAEETDRTWEGCEVGDDGDVLSVVALGRACGWYSGPAMVTEGGGGKGDDEDVPNLRRDEDQQLLRRTVHGPRRLEGGARTSSPSRTVGAACGDAA